MVVAGTAAALVVQGVVKVVRVLLGVTIFLVVVILASLLLLQNNLAILEHVLTISDLLMHCVISSNEIKISFCRTPKSHLPYS